MATKKNIKSLLLGHLSNTLAQSITWTPLQSSLLALTSLPFLNRHFSHQYSISGLLSYVPSPLTQLMSSTAHWPNPCCYWTQSSRYHLATTSKSACHGRDLNSSQLHATTSGALAITPPLEVLAKAPKKQDHTNRILYKGLLIHPTSLR